MTEKNSFLLYQNFENQFSLLSMEDRGMLITAIFEYSRVGSVSVALSPIVQMAFSIIRDTLDRYNEAYLEKCRRNAENAKKGGRPKKDAEHDSEKTERFFSKPKKPDNDNDNDNDNDIDNDIVIEKEKKKEKEPSASAGSVRDRRRGEPLTAEEQLLADKARERAMAQYEALMAHYRAPPRG